MIDVDLETWGTKLAGVAGALVSMRFLSGTWPEKISFGLCGVVVCYYLGDWASDVTGLPERMAGFLLGFFGMAIASRVWEAIQGFDIAEATKALIDRIRGRAS